MENYGNIQGPQENPQHKKTEKFEQLRSQKNFPSYDVFPVTEDPVPYPLNARSNFSLTWQVAVAPALDLPNDTFFIPAGRPNNVRINNLIGVRGDAALFFHIESMGATRETRDEHRQRLERTIANMAIMANHTVDPAVFNETFFFSPERSTTFPDLIRP